MARQLFVFLFIVISIISSAVFAQEYSEYNLVLNPGYEDEFMHWTLAQFPSGWAIDQSNPYIGQKCCMFTFPSASSYYDAMITAPVVELYPGYLYYFGAHTYEIDTHDTWTTEKTIFDIILRDVNTGHYHSTLPQESASGWVPRGDTFTVSEVCTVRPEIHIHGYTTSGNAIALIDNVLLGILPPISTEESSWGRVKRLFDSE